jgi:hypothetical protein
MNAGSLFGRAFADALLLKRKTRGIGEHYSLYSWTETHRFSLESFHGDTVEENIEVLKSLFSKIHLIRSITTNI